jgi:hypothetical protein
MKLEITDAIDRDNRIILKMEYDEDFATAVAKIFGVRYASSRDIEHFVGMTLENLSIKDLAELRNKIYE